MVRKIEASEGSIPWGNVTAKSHHPANGRYAELTCDLGSVSMSWRDLWCGWLDVSFRGKVTFGDDIQGINLLGSRHLHDDGIRLSGAYFTDLLLDLRDVVMASVADPTCDTVSSELLFEMEEYGDWVATVTNRLVKLSDAHEAGLVAVTVSPNRNNGYARDLADATRILCAKVLSMPRDERDEILCAMSEFMEGMRDGSVPDEAPMSERIRLARNLAESIIMCEQ